MISDERLFGYHRYTRERGVNPILYVVLRLILELGCRIWFRLERSGRENARGIDGGLIVASNHSSFLDPFVIGLTLPWSRPGYFMAKKEMFGPRWQAWILNRLGAFPVRRGEADGTALETARLILERGGTLILFPEGTRIRSGAPGRPKRGVGRIALESGAPVLPVSVVGSEGVRRGWRIRPRKVRLRAGSPLRFAAERPTPGLAGEVTERIWADVELGHRR